MTTKQQANIREALLADPKFQAAKQRVLTMSQQELRDIQRALRQVANGRITEERCGCGICYNTQALCHDRYGYEAYTVVEYFSYGWPQHSGCVSFPVPMGKNVSYIETDLWQGQQLIYRQSLMAHIIKQIDLFLAYQAEREGKENDYEG